MLNSDTEEVAETEHGCKMLSPAAGANSSSTSQKGWSESLLSLLLFSNLIDE